MTAAARGAAVELQSEVPEHEHGPAADVDRSGSAGRIDLLFFGSLFADLVFTGVSAPTPGTEVYSDDFVVSPGGIANQAFAAARLGRRVAMLSAVGNDPVGEMLWRLMDHEAWVDSRWIDRCLHMRTPVTVSSSGPVDRGFVTYAPDNHPITWPVDAPPVGAVNIGIGAEFPDWVARLRSAGTTVVASTGWDETGEWPHSDLERLSGCDTFILNDAEASNYLRTEDLHAAARELGEHVPEVVITRGRHGALVHTSAGRCEAVPGLTVDARDSTGAGDVFLATFMATFDTGFDLADRVRLSSVCAGLSVTRLGGAASAPTAREVLDLMARDDDVARALDFAAEWLADADRACRRPPERPVPAQPVLPTTSSS